MDLLRAPLQPEAIRCYRFLFELSLLFDVISEETHEERLAYLNELLAGPMDPDRAIGSGEAKSDADSGDATAPHYDGDDLMHFISVGPLRDWVLHEGGPNGLPSDPHGHENPKWPPFPKLDRYLGWIQSSTTTTSGRLRQALTGTLWNDPKFRTFARATLTHFAQKNPKHHWRVESERIFVLPRRRR